MRRSFVVTVPQKKTFGVNMKVSVRWRKRFEGGIRFLQHADDLAQVYGPVKRRSSTAGPRARPKHGQAR